jgi:hypothetical protein
VGQHALLAQHTPFLVQQPDPQTFDPAAQVVRSSRDLASSAFRGLKTFEYRLAAGIVGEKLAFESGGRGSVKRKAGDVGEERYVRWRV